MVCGGRNIEEEEEKVMSGERDEIVVVVVGRGWGAVVKYMKVVVVVVGDMWAVVVVVVSKGGFRGGKEGRGIDGACGTVTAVVGLGSLCCRWLGFPMVGFRLGSGGGVGTGL